MSALPLSLRGLTTVLLITLAGCAVPPAGLRPSTPEPPPHGAVPSAQHLRWHRHQFYAFVHFNMNTFTGVEWGHGDETPQQFHPTAFDADQWCSLFAECGLTGVILTAKHHDGFCLWPSAFTEHDVASSGWRDGDGDVVRELADACRRHGLFLGIYISPWDRNNPIYGKDDDAYNAYFVGQLEELLGNYGEIAEVWWDGANGDRNNPDKHQEYDWQRFHDTVARLQPDAVTFCPPYANPPCGVRWVGNESGHADPTQWSTYPIGVPERAGELNVGIEGADTWFPAETDVSIRSGWYWHPDTDDDVKSVDELLDIHYRSVGHNTNLLLNFAVDRRGLVHANEAAALRGMTSILKATFARDLARGCTITTDHVRGDPSDARDREFYGPERMIDGDEQTYWSTDDDRLTDTVQLTFAKPTTCNRLVLQEHIALGQRVRGWHLEALVDGEWRRITAGTTIGYRRVARFDAVTTTALRVHITDSRACPTISTIGVFVAPAEVTIRPHARVFLDATTVELATDQPHHAIHYTLDGSAPTAASPRYTDPFEVSRTCTLRAVAIAADGVASPRIADLELVGFTADTLTPSLQFLRQPDAGLRVARYQGGWQTLDQMADREPVSTGTCAGFSIDERTRDEHTALAFTGYIQVPADGVYEFFVTSDDGSRLHLDRALLVDNDGLHGMNEASGMAGLKAGYHPIRVEWFNAAGGRGLEVRWAGPGVPKQIVPASVLVR